MDCVLAQTVYHLVTVSGSLSPIQRRLAMNVSSIQFGTRNQGAIQPLQIHIRELQRGVPLQGVVIPVDSHWHLAPASKSNFNIWK
jgi:hypothetical protein